MTSRARIYIEDRLIAPAGGATEALNRLREEGEDAAADKLLAALHRFNDECRAIRLGLFYPGAS